MGKGKAWMLVVLMVCYALLVAATHEYEDETRERKEREEGGGESEWMKPEGDVRFLLHEAKHIVKTEAGEMWVARGYGQRIIDKPLHIGFISMEPRTLFIPQYLDASLILFVSRGEARIGAIYKDEFVERKLKTGDIYRIAAGSAFYLVNTAEGQRLRIICGIDTSESLGWGGFHSFYIAGGTFPTSVLAGFEPQTLATAFNITRSELRGILTRQKSGPIMYFSDSHSPSLWTRFLDLEHHERQSHLRRIVQYEEGKQESEETQPTWSLRKLLISLFGDDDNRKGRRGSKAGPESYNLYDRKPDFHNNYGWSIALEESDYHPLGHSGIGIYLVNITAGSMMAPHINPIATEYGIVLRGTGNIQIVYPNGTLAMNAKVGEGDVFWVPRYFPFCQIASRSGSFEFFGFTTSARKNRPQFLVGANSLLQSTRGPEFAAAFGISEDKYKKIIDAQREAVILPSSTAAPSDVKRRGKDNKMRPEEDIVPKLVKSFGNKMIMGFD